MLARPRQVLDALSISALDLFASALGAFMLLAVSFFPYYLRAPALERDNEGAKAELAAAAQALSEADAASADAEKQKADAAEALARAQEHLQRAQASAKARSAAAAESPPAPTTAVEAPVEAAHSGPRRGHIAIADLDLVFVMDTTGSMRDELRDLQANLVGIIQVLQRLAPTLRVGFVAYRDRGDAYVLRGVPLTAVDERNDSEVLRFVRGLSAEGGGDEPERVDEAVAAAAGMAWRSNAQGRIVVIGDAPAHPADVDKVLAEAARFHGAAAGGGLPRVVSTIFTGDRPAAKGFFERLAKAGGGEMSVHKGQMIESILLAVLGEPATGEARQ